MQLLTSLFNNEIQWLYMSSEYVMEGLFSIKSNVFSFGVLLIEILSGKKNTSFYQSDSINLIGHVSTGPSYF